MSDLYAKLHKKMHADPNLHIFFNYISANNIFKKIIKNTRQNRSQ